VKEPNEGPTPQPRSEELSGRDSIDAGEQTLRERLMRWVPGLSMASLYSRRRKNEVQRISLSTRRAQLNLKRLGENKL